MLLASLVLRVITISSGVTRRNSASALRVFSFSPVRRARFWPDGSRSTLSVSRRSASSTGREAGQRLAAFNTPRSGGITNCSRTDFQKASPVPAEPGAKAGAWGVVFAQIGSANKAAEPPRAKRRAKSRRDTEPAMEASAANSTSSRRRMARRSRESARPTSAGTPSSAPGGAPCGSTRSHASPTPWAW